MKSYLIYIILVLTLFTACSSQHQQTGIINYGFQRDSIRSGKLERTFLYHTPALYDDTSKIPLVIILHAFLHTGQTTLDMGINSLRHKLVRDTAVVVFPDAVGRHWNDKMGGSYPASDTVDDVGFLTRLIDHFINKYNCDPGRVYLLGVSNGGFMAYRMSCVEPEKITAICTFISSMGMKAIKQYGKVPPMPVMIINGTADDIVKWKGGKVGRLGKPIAVAAPVEDNIDYWRRRNGVTSPADITELPDYCRADSSRVIKYCYKGKCELVFYKVVNGGHNVPFRSSTALGKHQNCDWDALGAAWDFLLSKRDLH